MNELKVGQTYTHKNPTKGDFIFTITSIDGNRIQVISDEGVESIMNKTILDEFTRRGDLIHVVANPKYIIADQNEKLRVGLEKRIIEVLKETNDKINSEIKELRDHIKRLERNEDGKRHLRAE